MQKPHITALIDENIEKSKTEGVMEISVRVDKEDASWAINLAFLHGFPICQFILINGLTPEQPFVCGGRREVVKFLTELEKFS